MCSDPNARRVLRDRAVERRRQDAVAAEERRTHDRAIQQLAHKERLAKAEAEAAKAKGAEARAAAKASAEKAKIARESAREQQAPVRHKTRILSHPRGVEHRAGPVVGNYRLVGQHARRDAKPRSSGDQGRRGKGGCARDEAGLRRTWRGRRHRPGHSGH